MTFPELLALSAIALAAPHMNKHLATLMSLIFAIWALVLSKGWFA